MLHEIIQEAKVQIERLKVEDGAVFVVRIKDPMMSSASMCEHFRSNLQKWFGNLGVKSIKVIIIGKDVDISLLSEAQMREHGWVKIENRGGR